MRTTIESDIMVIGGSMAGLLTAYYLQKNGKKVVVLEVDKIGSGQSGHTTAKITSQHDIKYSTLIKKVGLKKARMYAMANEKAIKDYEELINTLNIPCDFEKCEACLYTMENEKTLKAEYEAAINVGIDAYYSTETELPFDVKGALYFRNQARFSARKFMEHLSKFIDIQENTRVLEIRGNEVITKDKIYIASKIVIATHYPILNVPGFYFLRQHQERSYVLALSKCPPLKNMYYGIDKDGLSFRQMEDYLILGGGSHRTGKNPEVGSFCYLRQQARIFYPKAVEMSCWAAQDCMPHDGIPFIGKYSIRRNNLYVITGFQKWGMTTSMVAAHIITDMIYGNDNPYCTVFSPQRFNIRAGFSKLMLDIGVSIKGLTLGWFGKREKRCPHLGCKLVWNHEEKTWDCPCHGSRFEENGKVIDNPAIKSKC